MQTNDKPLTDPTSASKIGVLLVVGMASVALSPAQAGESPSLPPTTSTSGTPAT